MNIPHLGYWLMLGFFALALLARFIRAMFISEMVKKSVSGAGTHGIPEQVDFKNAKGWFHDERFFSFIMTLQYRKILEGKSLILGDALLSIYVLSIAIVGLILCGAMFGPPSFFSESKSSIGIP